MADNTLSDELNLLQHTRAHLNHSSNDVAWHTQQASQLVTGAKTGVVLLWDLNKSGSKCVRTLSIHSRAVNRLCFDAAEGRLLTASQDKSAKLMDCKLRFAAQQTFATAAEVRDVHWSATTPAQFAAALENGMVQVFDIRTNKQCLMQWQGHHGRV
mmetsp:Transcript_5442/g.12538  ORF Transcript_5442/g.12538 Transcript_5442/m.12538 type:complete len:156 (-) Transcript_5442:14-481(-)